MNIAREHDHPKRRVTKACDTPLRIRLFILFLRKKQRDAMENVTRETLWSKEILNGTFRKHSRFRHLRGWLCVESLTEITKPDHKPKHARHRH